MKNFLITILVLGMAAAGCGREHVTSPVPQWHSWDQVVLAETRAEAGEESGEESGEPVSEISVHSDGALTLVVGRGNEVSSRGLLSGDKMETLTSLIDALPPSSFVGADPCPNDGFVVTVAGRGSVRTFAFGSCDSSDSAVPEAARRLQEFLSETGASTQAPRLVVVPFQVLLRGTQSALHRPVRAVLRDRDALAGFLREHAPDRPVALPAIDFGRRVVIAEWLGDQPTTRYAGRPEEQLHTVEFEGADITQTGWFRLHFRSSAPGPTCEVGAQITQPFVLVAVDRHTEEMLFEDATTEVDCSPPPTIRGGW
jgi:hypothetical protein